MNNLPGETMNIRFAPPKPLLILASLLFSCAALFGQATDSNVAGTVLDASGAGIPSATVVATNRDTNVKYDTVTNAAGEYRLNNVPVGTYSVTASAANFTDSTVSGVQLELNRTVPVNVTLEVAAVSTEVNVVEAAAPIDTVSSQVQQTWSGDSAQNLPTAGISKAINGAGIYNISLGNAGVAMAGGIGYGTGPSVAGQRTDNNTFAIDGVSNDDHDLTGPLITVPNEAVSQFSVLQNQFSPEFGGASGGVFNVILKSGANQIHGSIYEYLQNRNLNAVDNSQVLNGLRTNPRFDNNRFGATIGGPIKKEKLFYFANYEYNPVGQASHPSSTVFAPTAAGVSLLNVLSGFSKTNLGIFEKYVPVAATASGTVSVAGTSIPIGSLSFAAPNYSNSYNALLSIDWNASNTDELRGRYINNNVSQTDTNAALPVFYASQPTFNNMISLSEFHSFSPTMENEIRVSYARHNQVTPVGSFSFPGLSAFPNLAIDDLSLQIGPDPNSPGGELQNSFSIQENLTKTVGLHTFKMGYYFNDVILSSFFVQRSRGDYDYHTLEQYLLDQQPSGGDISNVSGERTFGTASGVPEGFLQNAAFFNDDYRIRPNLTLNLGLRYEIVTVPVASRAQKFSAIASVPGVFDIHEPKISKNDWSPRIGFAYSPGRDQKWSIRGGFGRSFDLSYANLNSNANPPFYQTTQDVNSTNPVSNFLANGGITAPVVAAQTAAGARATFSTFTWDQIRPYALNGTIGVQRLLGKDYTVEARYVYTKGVHLYVQDRLNIAPQVTPTNFIPTFFTMPSAAQLSALTTTLGNVKSRIVPGGTASLPANILAAYGFTSSNIVGFSPYGNSRYNGLALQMTKRFSKNFQYVLAYTLSLAQDDSTATLNSTAFTPRRGQDFQNIAGDWSDSALDHRHRLTISPSYDLQMFQNQGWVLKNLVSNWSLNGTYTYQTGEWATPQSGVDANLNGGDNAGDRTIVNSVGAANLGTGVTGYNAQGQAIAANSPAAILNTIVAYVANNSNARYVVAGAGALANAGRNTVRMPGTNNFDVSLLKRFGIAESKRVEFGAQFFNLFNHPQYVGGWINDVSPNGTLGATLGRNELVPSNAKFQKWSQSFTSNSRVVQIVGRIVF